MTSSCCTVAVKVASIYAGLAKTGYVITSKFDLRWLVNINHCDRFHFDVCPFNSRSRKAGCNRSPGCRVFTNMAVTWILLPVFAAWIYPGILSWELSSCCVSWNRTTVTLWVSTRCSMVLIFALVKPSKFSCSSETPCHMGQICLPALKRVLAPVQYQTLTLRSFISIGFAFSVC